MTSYSSLYLHNFGIVKSYNDKKFKVTCMKSYKQSGFEDDKKFTAKGEVNETKLDNNLSRAKSRVYELAFCNDWELFVTFTLDKTKYDRKDLNKYRKDLSQYIRDYKKKYKVNIKYLLVPERHEDGSWHMHGFMMGLPKNHLTEFSLSDHLPYKILNRLKEGKRVYSWNAYSNKFGFTDIEFIESHERSSSYITKYVTKEALRTVTELNAHMYYCSQGLNCSEVVHQDNIYKDMNEVDYSNDYVKVKYCDSLKEAMSYFEQTEEQNEY